MVIDSGLPVRLFEDVLASAGSYVDLVKFGWGTSVVTDRLASKIRILEALGIDWFFGGTLFEKHILQGRFEDYRRWCHAWGCRFVEVSNGTIDMSNEEKAGYIDKLGHEFRVLSEVGHKQPERADRLVPAHWAEYVLQDLDAGAHLVILEAREAGTIGIADSRGNLRAELLEEVLATGVAPSRLLLEAPTKALQTGLIRRLGPDANLGNIAPADVIGLETLRLGLRSDTLDCFEGC
jgi:phosphosulfolactate synthase